MSVLYLCMSKVHPHTPGGEKCQKRLSSIVRKVSKLTLQKSCRKKASFKKKSSLQETQATLKLSYTGLDYREMYVPGREAKSKLIRMTYSARAAQLCWLCAADVLEMFR